LVLRAPLYHGCHDRSGGDAPHNGRRRSRLWPVSRGRDSISDFSREGMGVRSVGRGLENGGGAVGQFRVLGICTSIERRGDIKDCANRNFEII
jgi:hypothetical protein